MAAKLAFERVDTHQTQKSFRQTGARNTPDKIARAIGTFYASHGVLAPSGRSPFRLQTASFGEQFFHPLGDLARLRYDFLGDLFQLFAVFRVGHELSQLDVGEKRRIAHRLLERIA